MVALGSAGFEHGRAEIAHGRPHNFRYRTLHDLGQACAGFGQGEHCKLKCQNAPVAIWGVRSSGNGEGYSKTIKSSAVGV